MTSNALNAARLARVDPGSGYGKLYHYTSGQTLGAELDGALVTNLGATASVTHTMFAALTGRELQVLRVTNFPIVLTPAGTDAIAGQAPGATFTLSRRGLYVLACSSAGFWEVIIQPAKPAIIETGTATFAAATTVAVTFTTGQDDTSYEVFLTAQADPTGRLYVDPASKSTSGFTITNTSSTSVAVSWVAIRN